MTSSTDPGFQTRSTSYGRRVWSALTPFRFVIALALTLIFSTRILLAPNLFDFFTAFDIALAWLEYVVELAPIAVALTIAYTLFDEGLPSQMPFRVLLLCALLFASAVAIAVAYLGILQGFDHLPSDLGILAHAFGFGIPAVFCAVVAEVDRRTRRLDAAALESEMSRSRIERDETEQQLQILQAQIEPHFLFNTLANVRRLYRMQPESGSAMVARLMVYLRAALPQMRRPNATLGDELELVKAYLDLFQVRMGGRLSYSIEVAEELRTLEFPPMLMLTLVENAIKHGIDPSNDGGHIAVTARRRGRELKVSVSDSGVGFGVAGSSGTGVGLANIRRQLAARYGVGGRLELGARTPTGVCAQVSLPAVIAAHTGWSAAPSVEFS